MKFRVRHFADDKFVVQRQVKIFGLFAIWRSVLYTIRIGRTDSVSNRNQPMLGSFDEAVRLAEKLSRPGEYEKQQAKRQADWALVKSNRAAAKKNSQRVFVTEGV